MIAASLPALYCRWAARYYRRGAGCAGSGARGWAHAVLQFVDPRQHYRPGVAAGQALVVAVLRQGILRTAQVGVVEDAEVQVGGGALRVERDRLLVGLFGVAIVVALAVQDA